MCFRPLNPSAKENLPSCVCASEKGGWLLFSGIHFSLSLLLPPPALNSSLSPGHKMGMDKPPQPEYLTPTLCPLDKLPQPKYLTLCLRGPRCLAFGDLHLSTHWLPIFGRNQIVHCPAKIPPLEFVLSMSMEVQEDGACCLLLQVCRMLSSFASLPLW